ncbi:MAG: hypothetical protein QM733_17080 [Ilumatobacteraceae bacterium]
MVVDDGLQQGRGLGPDVRVRVLAADRRLRPGDRRSEQSDVTHTEAGAEQALGERNDVVEIQVLNRTGHSPSRSSA